MKLKKLVNEEEGQGMTEYVLIVGIIAVFLVTALVVFRGKLPDLFN